MTIAFRDALAEGVKRLTGADVPDPEVDAGWLLRHVCGSTRVAGVVDNPRLTESQYANYLALLDKRSARTPLQYILGDVEFCGAVIRVDERVLIPRFETEWMCHTCEEYIKARRSAVRVLDLCTGSGAIAIALKRSLPDADVSASDISPEALSMARENASHNGVTITFTQGDLLEPWRDADPFDVIISNPPYVCRDDIPKLQPEPRCEPALALDGGADGLDFYRRIAKDAPCRLTHNGALFLELGQGQRNAVTTLLEPLFERVTIDNDLRGIPRVIRAINPRGE